MLGLSFLIMLESIGSTWRCLLSLAKHNSTKGNVGYLFCSNLSLDSWKGSKKSVICLRIDLFTSSSKQPFLVSKNGFDVFILNEHQREHCQFRVPPGAHILVHRMWQLPSESTVVEKCWHIVVSVTSIPKNTEAAKRGSEMWLQTSHL